MSCGNSSNICSGDQSYIGYWATGIWQYGLGQPSSISSLSLSGWLTSSYVIGKIDTLLQTCHSGCSGIVSPCYSEQELGIAEKMYMANYYGLLARGAVAGNNLISTKDGDAAISFSDNSRISKNFLDAAKVANDELNYLVSVYRSNDAVPRDVSFYYILFNDWQGSSYWGAQGYIG